jgi:hypothetical protein
MRIIKMKKIILSLLGMGLLISANSYATTVSNLKFDFRADQPIFFEPALSYFDSSGEYVLDVWAREAIEPMPVDMMLMEQRNYTTNIRPLQLLGGIGAGGGQMNGFDGTPGHLLGSFELLNFRIMDLDPTNGFFGNNALSLISDIKLTPTATTFNENNTVFLVNNDPFDSLPPSPRTEPYVDQRIWENGLGYGYDHHDGSTTLVKRYEDGRTVFSKEYLGQDGDFIAMVAEDFGVYTFSVAVRVGGAMGIESLEFGVPVANEVPIPAAAWLFGSALAGLSVVRRRK